MDCKESQNLTSNTMPSAEINLENESSQINTESYDAEAIGLLSTGFLELHEPSLVKVQKQLRELSHKQSILDEQLHNENINMSWSLNNGQLQEIFSTMQIYNSKLLNIKKEMRSLHERSTKLKNRAIRLQQHKEKETYIKAQQLKQEEIIFPNNSRET